MSSISLSNSHALPRAYPHHLCHSQLHPCRRQSLPSSNSLFKLQRFGISDRYSTRPPLPLVLASSGASVVGSFPIRGTYTVGDFMTRKENLYVVKPTTTADEALEALVEKRITGFPVVDEDWNLVGVISDYDLLALDSISGGTQSDTNLFPDVDSSWKTFNELQKLLCKTNGKVVGDLMTPAPLVVRETSNLEDAARLLLETKYRRLPVVDADGKLVGIITRGNVVRAALQIKRAAESST
ncbi:CBS domain-containing protein CBSX2, chloroplastic-like isoform X2 [Cucurbita moschata]|uniref:CBS domain-containing protein CBSX2, chloroplastic-like isoform X2 n=1 Tax=Cucurbita moschata TaxID=3662 RepID=A0A6J1E4V3_CUCMO|nr:CBS domain-containing protein CBSX2, chloroplastic-like isoform X2 [Cucurbita moschata]